MCRIVLIWNKNAAKHTHRETDATFTFECFLWAKSWISIFSSLKASDSTYNKFGNCHCTLIASEKLNRLKNNKQFFLDSKVKDTGQITVAGETDRQLEQQNQCSENHLESQCQGGKIWPLIDKVLEAQSDQLEFKTPKRSSRGQWGTILCGLPLEAHASCSRKYWRKILLCFQKWKENSNHFALHWNTL